MIGRPWEHYARLKFLAVGYEKYAIPHLRNPVKGRVDEAIARRIAKVRKRFSDLTHDVMPAVVENVWYVLDKQRKRLCSFHIMEVSEVEVTSWVDFERAGVLSDFAKLCTTNPGVGLARRASNQDVKGVFHWTEAEFLDELFGFNTGDVAWSGVQRLLLRA